MAVTYVCDCDVEQFHGAGYAGSVLCFELAFLVATIELQISHASLRLTMYDNILKTIPIIIQIKNLQILRTNSLPNLLARLQKILPNKIPILQLPHPLSLSLHILQYFQFAVIVVQDNVLALELEDCGIGPAAEWGQLG